MNAPISTAYEATSGLWRNNLALVQLLGLCPLLAVTTSLVNGLALGLATMTVLLLTNVAISLMRRALLPIVRIPLYLLLIASLVTSIDLLTNAVFDELHQALGIFIPLIVTNCSLLMQAETVASRRPPGYALASAFAAGSGFLVVLMALGALRELLGHGTLFAGIEMLTGESGTWLTLELPFDGMLVAVLPPGAFLGMALLLALRNRLTAAAPDTAASATARETTDPSR